MHKLYAIPTYTDGVEQRFTLLNKGMKIVGVKNVAGDRHRPTVILLHGFTGSKNEAHDIFSKASDHLASRGMNTIRFDFRYGRTQANGNESDGTIAEMTISDWVSDARTVARYASRMPGVDPRRIAFLGLSMGGLTAICEAARDMGVSAVAAWSTPSNLSHKLADPQTARSFRAVASRNFDAFLRSASKHVPARSISRLSPRPVLIMAGTADRIVSPQEAHELFDNACEPRTLALIGGGNHTFSNCESQAILITAAWLESVWA